MSYAEIRVEIEAPIASIVLARPETRNALTEAMGREIARAVAEVNARMDIRAVLVCGDGKGLSAGGDLAMIEQRWRASVEENRAGMRRFYELFLSVRSLRAPSIAILHGAVRGAAVCLALACDLRLAEAEATLALNFVRIGLHPGMGATYLLPRLVGPARAAELLLTGRTIGAEEALRIGLVNAVHPGATALTHALALAREIAAAAPIAVQQAKRTLVEGHATLDEALEAEAGAQAVDYATEDLLEGVRAARDKRLPKFEGR